MMSALVTKCVIGNLYMKTNKVRLKVTNFTVEGDLYH